MKDDITILIMFYRSYLKRTAICTVVLQKKKKKKKNCDDILNEKFQASDTITPNSLPYLFEASLNSAKKH